MTRKNTILFGPLPPPYGGVSVFMDAIRDAAIARGIRIWSYTGDRAEIEGSGQQYVDHRRLDHVWAAFRLGRNARVADSTHFHLEHPNPLLLPLWIAAKVVVGFTWIKILHDGSLPSRYVEFSSIQKRLFQAAIRNIDEFVAVSPQLGDWLKESAGFAGKVTVIPPLLPLPNGSENESHDPKLSERLERYSNFPRRVCSIGVFIPSYGFHEVVAAIEKLRAGGIEVGLFIVDGSVVRDEDYMTSVLKGRDWIEVASDVPHPQLKHVFEASDVFVRSFGHESYGLSRIEALWAGVPVIATNAGETRGMLTYDFGDVEQLAAHLREVFEGRSEIDVKTWADLYRSKADANLESYLRTIIGDEE